MSALPFDVRRGSIVNYRLFDLGDDILLDEAQRLLAEGNGEGAKRLHLTRSETQALQVKVPPLDVELDRRPVELPRWGAVEARVSVRLFDYGSASVRYEVEIPPGTPLSDLIPILAHLYEPSQLDADARSVIEGLAPRLERAIVGGPVWGDLESYTAIYVVELEGHPTAEEVLAQEQLLARLLLGERGERPLAEGEVRELLRYGFSYHDDDLVLINWDSAFVLEPSGTRDILHVMEFACAQLTSLRGYDDALDRQLEQIYDMVAQAGSGPLSLIQSPYGKLARDVQERWLGLTELRERIDNAIKVVGDLYLARVYRAAVERYRVPAWQNSVYRKQTQIAQVYELLRDETDVRRSIFLELAIVILIVVEIVLFFAE